MYLLKWLVLLMSLFLIGCGGSGNSTQNKNEEIPTSKPLRVVCVGDSITEGYKLSDANTESYPAQLGGLVADGVKVSNFGIRGTTALKKSNAPYWSTTYYSDSKSINPEVVVMMFGTNDIKDINWKEKGHFVDDYTDLVRSYQNLSSKPTVYVCLPPPVYANIQGISNQRIEQELIPMIKEVSSRTNTTIVDIHTLLSNKASLFPDKVHPNKEGARQIAQLVYQTIY